MSFTPDLVAELEFLTLFNLGNNLEGLKVHHDAKASVISAAQRLHGKGLITQVDGGYLTTLGHEAAEQAQSLLSILSSARQAA